MSKNNFSYENFEKVRQATAVIRIENPDSPGLINNIYYHSCEYDDPNEFLLSCLKDWVVYNFYHEVFYEEQVKEYLSSINIIKETEIDFQKKVSNFSMRRFDYLMNYLKAIEIDFASAKQFITYIDGSYERLGMLLTHFLHI